MTFLWHGLQQAWHLIVTGDPYLRHLIWVTIKVVAVSTAVAVVVGLPLGVLLGIGNFRGRRLGMAVANAGLVLPPVVVGLVVSLLMFPAAPLGRFHLLFTLKGVYIAQTLLALPIVIALTAAAVRAVPAGLLAQARALDARTQQVWALALREARLGVLAAVIAAVGSALSEVGAVVLVGGNIEGSDQTLASATIEQVNAGHFSNAVAIGIVLLGVIIVITAVLTIIQQRDETSARLRRPW